MIVVLHDKALAIADEIASELRDSFRDHVDVRVMSASSRARWPSDASWDDLLIVLFDKSDFPEEGDRFITEYLERTPPASLLPVALDVDSRRPPKAAERIKALPFDTSARGVHGKIVHRAGAMLGLRVQKRDHQIFISYRTADGAVIAKQLESLLANLGYPVWRDEAVELDGDTKILPGSDVQRQIDEALDRASLVLLVDTPSAPHSVWIRHEIDTANGILLPVLPLCFRAKADRDQGPRFKSLLDLQRWVSLTFTDPTSAVPSEEIDKIVVEMETFLCEVFRRKCRVPFVVEKEFVKREFAWRVLDKRLLIYESQKKHSGRLSTKVLSHCSIFHQVRGPGLRTFCEFLKNTGRGNYSLYIYDGELLSAPQIKEITDAQTRTDDVIILHHQELAALIDSNFTAL